MEGIGIRFSDEVYGMLVNEAKRRKITPETLLKIWILERAKLETIKGPAQAGDALLNLLVMPLRIGLIVTASATVTIGTLAEELTR